MQPFPHRYSIAVAASYDGDVALEGVGLPRLISALPAEFGGPGDRWSPETLLVAAVAGCFVLTFRAIALANTLNWTSLTCNVDGTLDRIDRVSQFTGYLIRVRLCVPAGTSQELAQRLLVRTEQTCLVGNSLKVAPRLEAIVEVGSCEHANDYVHA